jgi:hypothetical protein
MEAVAAPFLITVGQLTRRFSDIMIGLVSVLNGVALFIAAEKVYRLVNTEGRHWRR